MKEMIFISIPMNGRKDGEIVAEMQELFGKYKAEHPDAELIDSVFTDEQLNQADFATNPAVFYLGQSLSRLAFADKIIFAKGWEKARGCRIEYKVATYYDIPIILA